MKNRTHYLYRHIRPDKNEPFYIGIGTIFHAHTATIRMRYARAYSKDKRSKFWNKIVNKCGYEVDIMFESNDYEIIWQKEKEFIKLYGRRCLGEGTLVNFAEGGKSGSLGMKYSEEYKANMWKHRTNTKKVYAYTTEGKYINEYPTIAHAAKTHNLSPPAISGVVLGRYKYTGKYGQTLFFSEKYLGPAIEPINCRDTKCKKIGAFDEQHNLIHSFESLQDVKRILNYNLSCVGLAIKKHKPYKKLYWFHL